MARILKTLILTLSLIAALPVSAGMISGDDPVISTGTVYRTIDGDTFLVNMSDRSAYLRIRSEAAGDPDRIRHLNDAYSSIKVRLASVGTPESTHKDPKRNTAEGREVSAIVTKLTEGKYARVSCYDWGVYGRPVCNLGIKDSGSWADVGGWLIQHGFSPYDTYFGRNPFYDSEYRALEANAPQWP